MINITAIVSTDAEVISASDFGSEKEFQFKVLNSLDFKTITEFFIKKTIIQAVLSKHNSSNGSNGISVIDLLNIYKWKDIETYVEELEQKKIIEKRQGVNSDMYFYCKK